MRTESEQSQSAFFTDAKIPSKVTTMLWTVFVIILVMWALGLASFKDSGRRTKVQCELNN